MPTANPRVNVTLSPSLDALLVRMSAVQGVSKSQVLRELLIAAEPALQRAVALMEAAAEAPRQVLGGLASSMERAQDKVEAVLAARLAEVEGATADLVSLAERVQGRRPVRRASGAPAGAPRPSKATKRAEVAASTPVPVTRGSGSPVPRSTAARKGVKRG